MSGLGRFVADRTGRVVAATLIGPVLALAPMIGDSAAAAVPMDLTEDCAPADPGNVFDGTPWPQEQTDLRSAWRFAEEGKGVQIAVIDTGFLPQHPQLQDITSAEYPAATFITVGEVQNTSLTPFNDCVGHGTEVTSVIAAQFSDEVEFVGVAPYVDIIPIRVQYNEDIGAKNADIASAIHHAVDVGADIINVSLETTQDNDQLREAVARAGEEGVLIVAAAGNNGSRPAYPARYAGEFPHVISVGAVDRRGVIMGGDANPTSGTSSNTTLVAPGVEVPVATGTGGYAIVNGTSYAAPFVSGVAALVLNVFPDLEPAQVRRRLEITAEHAGYDLPDKRYGWGMVNPVAAVTAVLPEDLDNLNKDVQKFAPKPVAPLPPDDGDPTMRNRALAAAGGACGLAIVAIAVAFVYRRGHARQWKPGLPESPAPDELRTS